MRKYEAGGDVVDETGMSFGTIKRNTETGELYDTEDSFKPVPKSMPVTETKAKTESKKETKKETKAEPKKESKTPPPTCACTGVCSSVSIALSRLFGISLALFTSKNIA